MPIIEVSGKVASSQETQTGKGLIKFWEKSNFRGQDKFVLWTVWFDQPMLHITENDEVTINGRLSSKVGRYIPVDSTEEKIVVEHHLNDPVVVRHVGIATEPAAFVPDEEVPF